MQKSLFTRLVFAWIMWMQVLAYSMYIYLEIMYSLKLTCSWCHPLMASTKMFFIMTPSHLPGPEPYKFKLPTSPIGQWTLKLKADKNCICKLLTDKTKSLLILQPSSWYICTNVVNFEELLDSLVFGFSILAPFKWYSIHTFTSDRY